MTDGCISLYKHNKAIITLHSNDKDWLEIINSYICPEREIKLSSENCYQLTINSIELAQWFINHQCTPAKSLTLQFPTIPIKYLSNFIRGCWDGDGTIIFYDRFRKDRKVFEKVRSMRLYTGSINFAHGLQSALNLLGIKSYIDSRVRDRTNTIKGRPIITKNAEHTVVLLNGEEVYNLCKRLYDNKELAMSRKQQIAMDIIRNWENKKLCIRCQIPLNLGKSHRNTKYCSECKKVITNENGRMAKLRYKNKLLNNGRLPT